MARLCAMSPSTCRVISGKAGAPSAVESFIPLYSGGLCEAVKLIPQIAPWVRIAWESVGVGVGSLQRRTRNPFAVMTSAHSTANFSPRKRVSCPTIISLLAFELKWVQMASVTARTPANVNSSAITARQPDVPKRIDMPFFKKLLN